MKAYIGISSLIDFNYDVKGVSEIIHKLYSINISNYVLHTKRDENGLIDHRKILIEIETNNVENISRWIIYTLYRKLTSYKPIPHEVAIIQEQNSKLYYLEGLVLVEFLNGENFNQYKYLLNER